MNKTKFPKLDGLIVEKFGTRKQFAEAMGITPTTLGAKMNGKSVWTVKDISKGCEVLGIPVENAGLYFLT